MTEKVENKVTVKFPLSLLDKIDNVVSLVWNKMDPKKALHIGCRSYIIRAAIERGLPLVIQDLNEGKLHEE